MIFIFFIFIYLYVLNLFYGLKNWSVGKDFNDLKYSLFLQVQAFVKIGISEAVVLEEKILLRHIFHFFLPLPFLLNWILPCFNI